MPIEEGFATGCRLTHWGALAGAWRRDLPQEWLEAGRAGISLNHLGPMEAHLSPLDFLECLVFPALSEKGPICDLDFS